MKDSPPAPASEPEPGGGEPERNVPAEHQRGPVMGAEQKGRKQKHHFAVWAFHLAKEREGRPKGGGVPGSSHADGPMELRSLCPQ